MKRFFSFMVFASIIAGFLLVACSKSGTYLVDENGGGGPHVFVPTDTLAPQLTIYTPVPNQEYTSGSVIHITGKLTDDYGLYRGTIKISNDADGSELVSQAYEIHGLLQYNFDLKHTSSSTSITNYTVKVAFEDHGNNHVSKSVKIKVNP